MRSPRCSKIRTSYIRGRALFLLYQLGPEGQQARRDAGIADAIR